MNQTLRILLPCLLIGPFVLSCTTSEPEDLPPNIILIISDDQGWTDYGFMQHPSIETPNLDTLAKKSLCFTRGYATAPLCSPSLATMITGLYAHQHGITGNDPAFDFEGDRYTTEWLLARKSYYDTLKNNFYQNKLLTEYLNEGGYRSLQTGKWWLGSWEEGHFDLGMTHGDPAKGGRHGDEGLKIGREGHQIIFDFIEKSEESSQPSFIWYAPFLPHTPHNPPEELVNKYRKETDSEPLAKYWAMCEWFDQACGELIEYVENSTSKRETVIIYTTDNGWTQNPDRNGYAPRSKRSPYEMGIRTPLMIYWPGKVEPRLDSTTLVSNIDLVPTILASAEVREDNLPGINLLDMPNDRNNRTVFAEAFDHDIADIRSPTQSLQYRIAIQNSWKLIEPDAVNAPGAAVELFNVETDPHEMTNLASERPDLVEQLKRHLDDWWKP